MTHAVTSFLTFNGHAEESGRLYITLSRDLATRRLDRSSPGEAGLEGTVKRVDFTVVGQDPA